MRSVIALACLIAACGLPETDAINEPAEIRPQDFVALPCGARVLDAPCLLAIAGGKRVLFGAPAGIGQALEGGDLRQLDVVMLFSLRSADIEGLDEVRNASWRAGRQTPLLVVGPEGTSRMAEALNGAFEQSDALRIVDEGIPLGGYDAAVLLSRELGFLTSSGAAFDTGDLAVTGRVGADGYVQYVVNYEVELGLAVCGIWLPVPEVAAAPTMSERRLCTEVDLSWPISDQITLLRPADP